jgi:hypothetical protein
MNRIGAVLFACGVAAVVQAGAARAASPDPKDLTVPAQELSKARALLQKLGSESYRDREDAQAELAKMGRLAKGVLAEAATGDEDPEIRLRAARLLPKANAADLKARIDTFLEDKEGKFDHDLPGLKAFRAKLGTTDKSRALYAEILKSPYNLELFAAVEKGNTEGGRAVGDRRNNMWMDMNGQRFPGTGRPVAPRQPTLADIAAVLFAESLVPSDSIPKTGQWAYMNSGQFLQQNPSVTTLNSPDQPHHAVYRTIAANWIGSRTDAMEMSNIVYMLNNAPFASFKESQTLLRRIVLTEGVQLWARGQALNMLVQKNGKEETKFLRGVLKNELRAGDYPDLYPNEKDPNRKIAISNEGVVQQVFWQKPGQPQGQQYSIQLRDAALAFLLHQEKLNLRDFGFETQPGFNPPPNQPLYFGQYAFTTDEQRTFGLVKWGWKLMKDSISPPAKTDEPKKDEPKKPNPQGDDSTKPRPGGGVKPVRPLPAVDLPLPVPAQPVPAPKPDVEKK